jgi:DNA polymerase elongation subunit (family B)
MNEKIFLVFDIETSPIPYESFSASQQEYLIRGAKTDEEIEKKKAEMGLTPLTAQVVTIGMKIVTRKEMIMESHKINMNVSFKTSDSPSYSKKINLSTTSDKFIDTANEYSDEEEEPDIIKKDYRLPELEDFPKTYFPDGDDCKSIALMTNPNLTEEDEPIINVSGETYFYQTTEKKVLDTFWRTIEKYKGCILITFNGRNFDAPFLMIRSAILEVRPSRNLMEGTKFSYQNHIDLADELTFYQPSSYGATKRFNFDFYTRAFGLVSPKSEGIDGSLVSVFYNNSDYKTIADYCLRDVDATWKLFLRIKDFIHIK